MLLWLLHGPLPAEAMPPHARLWLAALLATVLVAATLEGVVLTVRHRHGRGPGYDWRASAASLADLVARRSVDALGLSLATPVLLWAWAHRVHTWSMAGPGAWIALLLGEELCYYVYHRTAHRVRWFWATHAVHHSSPTLTLAAALRLGWTGKLTGSGLFFAPLLWLGFAPWAVFGMVAANLLYQFWLHAPWIPSLGPLEWVFNTPTHHAVHHACNPEYLDCNYGGVLIVFDRIFGSFVARRPDVVPRFGLTDPLVSHNPLIIAFREWGRLLRDLRHPPAGRSRWAVLFGPPGPAPHR